MKTKNTSFRLTPDYIKELNVFAIIIPELASIKRHAICDDLINLNLEHIINVVIFVLSVLSLSYHWCGHSHIPLTL